MIKFVNLRKSFGERVVLDGINLSIPAGQILFVLGTSGTGKSVLLKTLVGLLRPTSGEVHFFGREISGLSEEDYLEVRKNCGMVFQQPALFDSLSVFENVAYGLRRGERLTESEIEKRVLESLSLVHLEGVEHRRPEELSYGMQKRVSLARTVAIKPKVLLFDEPTTGLDPVTTRAINNLVQELSRALNTTSIVVSHDMACALEIADHIVVLDKGKIVDSAPPKELRRSKVPLVRDFLAEVAHE
jgi:phospholipid/cholesterol/gamma-HCH transport system ATP-binding protein